LGGGATVASESRGLRAPLRNRDFRNLAAGLATSQIGEWLASLALIVFVLAETESAAWVAAAGTARLIPYVVLGPFGGMIADRLSRLRVMVVSDVARVVSTGALAWVVASTGSALAAIVLSTVTAVLSVAYAPCVAASVPRIVREDELAAANAITTSIGNAAIALGPAFGGLLLVLGSPAWAFGANAATFLASALFVVRVRADLGPDRERPAAAAGRLGIVADLRDGFAALRSSPAVLPLLGSWTAVSFLYGLELVLLALVADERLGTGENGLALLYSAFGVGSVLAIGLASRTAARARQGRALAVATIVPGLALAGLAFTTSPVVGALLAAVDGAASLVLDVLVITSLQRLLGNEMMGRAYAASDALVVGALMVGTIAGAPLVEAVGLEAALVAGGGAAVAAGLVLLARAGSLDRRAEERARLVADRVALLAPLDLFAGASRATLEALAARSATEPLEAGADAVVQGAEPDDLFVVVEGTLVVTIADDGVVNRLEPGQAFGEIGLLRRVPRTATVTATSPCVLLRIPGEDFLRIVSEGVGGPSGPVGTLSGRVPRPGPDAVTTE
jgi:predicted MFS family arabinose efflux permease